MLEKKQVLPIGSVVSVEFAADEGKETIAVIVGHLTLLNSFKCCYDYICVEFPAGFEKGTFHINHSDIKRLIYCMDDHECKHEKWMERKYGEYMAYYNQYRSDLRPSIDELRYRKARVEDFLNRFGKARKAIRIAAIFVFIVSVGISVWHLESLLPVPIALFCVLGNRFGSH